MTKLELLKEVSEREFNIKETLQLLQLNKSIFWSWGGNGFTHYESKALFFNVSGRHFSGTIIITLAWNDTYTFRLVKPRSMKVVEVVKEVYFDELVSRIDEKIEKVEAYNF